MNIWPIEKSKRIRSVGFALFILSFIPGFFAFAMAPYLVVKIFIDFPNYGQWQEIVLAATLIIGWSSNFTVFFCLPRFIALFAIISPWILYFGQMFFNFNRAVGTVWPDTSVMFYYPFYPWAIGIGLIHLSRLMEPASKDYSRTSWNGF